MGADLMSETDFCAPHNMILDVTKIKECINADTFDKCNNECHWYKGKVVAENNELV
jgi:hypothetical protein